MAAAGDDAALFDRLADLFRQVSPTRQAEILRHLEEHDDGQTAETTGGNGVRKAAAGDC
jgi:hypothetical protein